MDSNLQPNMNERETFIEKMPEMSFFNRVYNLIVAPTKAFDNIKAYPKMGMAILVSMLLMGVYTFLLSPHNGYHTAHIMEGLRNEGIPFNESTYQVLMNPTLLTMSLGALFGGITVIFSWGIGGLFYFIFAKMFGLKDLTFKEIYSLSAHVNIPVTLVLILGAVLNSYVIKSGVDVFSLSILVPKVNYASFGYCILAGINLVSVYSTILLGYGLAHMAGRKPIRGILACALMLVIGIAIGAFSLHAPFLGSMFS